MRSGAMKQLLRDLERIRRRLDDVLDDLADEVGELEMETEGVGLEVTGGGENAERMRSALGLLEDLAESIDDVLEALAPED